MIRRNSMSLLHAMMEEMEQEQTRANPLRRSLRRSTAVDDSVVMDEEDRHDEDPPDLPTSPRPEIKESVSPSLSDEEHVETVRQKRSFDLTRVRSNRMSTPGGRHSLDNRRVASSTSGSSSTVQTPFTAVDYDFSFWESNSAGISLRSPTRSTFFSSTPCSDADQEDPPRSWSSRVVAYEESISVEWDTVSTSMEAVENDHFPQSIDDGGRTSDSFRLSGRSSSTTQLITSSGGDASPLVSPGGRMSSQSESALDEMDDDLLIGGGDLGRTKMSARNVKEQRCGLPSGDAKHDIQYQSLEDIVTAVSPIQDELHSSMGEERWRERRRKSDGGAEGGEERRRSKAEITPSHSPTRDDEDDDGDEEKERKTRLRVPSSLQQSLERIEGEEGYARREELSSVQSYLGVELESEEEFHEDDEYSDEDDSEGEQMEEMLRQNASADLGVIDEENDESRSRSVSRHADSLLYDRERTVTTTGIGAELRSASSIDEPSDFAPCFSPAFEGDVSTCDSISYARTPERETATSNTTTASESSELITTSTNTTTSREEERGEVNGHASHAALSLADRTVSNASTSPSEPEELAPGTCADLTITRHFPSEETMPEGLALHRRAISNHETRHEDMQQTRRESEIVRARSSGGRSSMMAGRCLSQVMTPVSLPDSSSAIDSPISRNLSSSDPALNELEQKEIRAMQQRDVDELYYDGGETLQPPPVLLPRKQSNRNSWRPPFAVATARGVMNPRIQVPSGASPGSRTGTPLVREPRERHGTMPAGFLESEMATDEKSSPISGSPSSAHYERGVLMRSSSHSAVGGFMRRSLRFLRGESAATPLTPITPPMYASSVSFGAYSAPGAPTLARKDSAPAAYGGTLRHTQSFDGECLPPLWSPSPMDDDIEEEPGVVGRPRTPVRRAPHRRTLGTFHSRPSPAKDRLKLRPSERSRVDKKKESGGSTRVKMLDSLSNAFFSERKGKKSKTSDRSLDGFMQQFGMKNTVHPRRPTMNDGASQPSASVEGLPDEIASVLEGDSHHHGTSRLHSTERSPSAVRSPNGADDYSFELRSLSLCSDLWDRFGLFDQEIHSAWHEKYSTEGMSSKQLKKQDAIFELVVQERRHCAHLAFLKKGYRQRLVEEHVLTAGDADRLIPDVLDAMLAFHLHLLDRLVERQRVAARVETVADIIAEELGDTGRFTTRAIDAYTSFGAAKESAEAYYNQLLNKGGRFAGFYNKLEADPNYRRYAYKTLLTVIIGRPTKYLLMLDQILKSEENEKVATQTKEAAETARKFAARIDYGLQVCQMSKKWEEIKGQLEQGSKTMLHTGEVIVPFTMDDLRRDTFANDSRKILCMGEAMVKQTTSQMGVYLILFDDILVVLQRKGGRMSFIQHEQAVLPVCSLHIRSTERQNSAFVISSCKPALLQFDFLNRNDRLKWVKVLETAIARAPKQVRMTPRSQSDSKQQARERAMEEERMRKAEEDWLRKLVAIFEERKPEEAALATYFSSRQKWFDELRRHVGEMPYRNKNEIPDKVRQTVRARFRELRAARVIPLAEMVERCTSAREGDLWSFFDDKHEMTAGPSEDSDSSGSGKSGKQPRRIQTFHGTTSETREKSSIRRHTTVPKMSECGSAVSADGLHRRTESDSEQDEESEHYHQEEREEREERMRMKSAYRIPLSLPLRARKASSRLVDDVVQLRLENNHLRNQAALDKTRIAFLERQRAPGYAAIVAPTETMEALRRKEQEVRDEETRVRETEDYGKAKLAQWQKELSEQKERLAVQEAELERKWLAYKEHTSTPSRSSSQKENGTPSDESRKEKRVERTASNCSELSPALKGLSVKSETRRKK